jgi:8-oxo-dGTP diphosphatase
MYTYEHPRPALTVDVVIFTIRNELLNLLLVRRKQDPFVHMWALPGGFVNIDESLDEAAARELEEETGVSDVYLEQLYTYGDPLRDPRGRIVTVAYSAIIPSGVSIRAGGGDDAAQAHWFPVEHLPELAFDHDEISAYALHRLQDNLEYSAFGFQLLPDEFTLSELQHTYEIILGKRVDKRNFRRRIRSAGVIEPTNHVSAGEDPPAQLYRYQPDAIAEVKMHRLFP